MHYKNASLEHKSNDWDLLTESVSITYEFLLFDYLRNNNIYIDDNNNKIHNRLRDLYKKSHAILENTTIYELVMNNKDLLNNNNLKMLPPDEKVLMAIKSDLEYYIGSLIALINYKNYKEGNLTIDRINKYSEGLSKYEKFESIVFLFDKRPTIKDIFSSIEFMKKELLKSEELKLNKK